MYLVVAYDIAENRKRRKLHKALKALVDPVQKSVFEGDLEDGSLADLLKTIEGAIDAETDTVRVYRLCARCQPVTEVLGNGVVVEVEQDPDDCLA